MESITPRFDQDSRKFQQPTTSNQPILFSQPTVVNDETSIPSGKQTTYQVKCNLLEYHVQEAILVNKALRSELKQYREKIDFEKRLRKFLVNRVSKGSDS